MTSLRISLGKALLTATALLLIGTAYSAGAVTLTHIHGLAYSADGKRIYIPSHHGLAIFSNGRWSKAAGPEHDYMGFSATRDRFYSSGHPAPGTGFINPFGLIVSADGGKTWQKRGLEGETDFHVLGTSYETNAVYVYNPAPNSRMKEPGVYYTLNDGFSWQKTGAKGLRGEIHAIAVHPSDPKSVAAATQEGIFVSRNSGDSFAQIAPKQGLAVFFDLNGEDILYSRYDGTPRLYRHDLRSGDAREIALPPLTRDAVSYIAQNPVKRNEYAVATFERSVFITLNNGKTWERIAENGRGK